MVSLGCINGACKCLESQTDLKNKTKQNKKQNKTWISAQLIVFVYPRCFWVPLKKSRKNQKWKKGGWGRVRVSKRMKTAPLFFFLTTRRVAVRNWTLWPDFLSLSFLLWPRPYLPAVPLWAFWGVLAHADREDSIHSQEMQQKCVIYYIYQHLFAHTTFKNNTCTPFSWDLASLSCQCWMIAFWRQRLYFRQECKK